MGAVRPAPRMRPVELDEEDDRPSAVVRSARDHAAAAAGPGGPDAPDAHRAERRWWPWGAGALAVVVGAAAVATGVTERAARERADVFAALPGVVRPLERPPVERWRTAADGPTPVLDAAGALVTVSGADGRWVVRSSDPATGTTRWEVPVVDQAGSGFESVAVACVAGEGGSGHLLCAWTEPDVVYGTPGGSTNYVPPTHVVALAGADGTQRGAWEVEGSVLGIQRHEDDVVVATGLNDRHVLVERRDGTDGTVRWSWTSPVPLVDNGGVRAVPKLVAGGDVVALMANSTTVLDARTGVVLEAGPAGQQILVAGLPDGGFATWEAVFGGTLRDADGTVRARVPGLPRPVVGDSSVDALVIDVGNRAVAVRADDGTVVWRLPTSMSPVAVAHGVVVMAGEASVGAVDGADGRLLWEQEFVAVQYIAPLTDGLHVLAPEPDGADGFDLVARGLRDGVEAWRVELPSDLRQLTAIDGRVVARTSTEVIVLA
ncbi:outer membrane protein assembly factor BamB family protein [Cellulomonas xiejunii]|uniref:outer membrane protein assembly factor BamB family protein n=1 Tax=Cellulomonas xiejunii TaxID=2968083 RepID=UPI001D0DF79F|nr:PQQ-binding-like beta-propeller repeat protein [Cellulomonas xiejunii]MCC2313359.1 PQQ-like beta-propeller repeat protein [Cellulomonas xiejunii]